MKNILKLSHLVLALTAITTLAVMVGCSADSKLPEPPIRFPFAVGQKGSKVEADVLLADDRYYSFSLLLSHQPNDDADRKRVEALTRSSGNRKNGIPIPVRLKIDRVDIGHEKAIIDKIFPDPELWAWGGSMGFVKLIHGERLASGKYHVMVESLSDIPELNDTHITFSIAFGHAK